MSRLPARRPGATIALVCALAACRGERAALFGTAHRPPGIQAPPRGTAAWVVDQYYAAPDFPDERAHIAGDFARDSGDRAPVGAGLPRDAIVTSRPLRQTPDSAVFSTTIRTGSRVAERYTYLVRDRGTWKIIAVRAADFSPAFRAAAESIAAGRLIPGAPVAIDSGLVLGAGPDSALAAYRRRHAALLDSVAHAYLGAPMPHVVDVLERATPPDRADPHIATARIRALRALLARAGVRAVFRDARHPACVFVRVTSEGGHEVGYLYAPDGCRPPTPDPGAFYYVERLAPHWYVYRAG